MAISVRKPGSVVPVEEAIEKALNRFYRQNPHLLPYSIHQTANSGRLTLELLPDRTGMLAAVHEVMHDLTEDTGKSRADILAATDQWITQHLAPPAVSFAMKTPLGAAERTRIMIGTENLGDTLAQRFQHAHSHMTLGGAMRASGARLDMLRGDLHPGSPREIWIRDNYIIVGNKAFFPDNSFGHFSEKKGQIAADEAALTAYFDKRGIAYEKIAAPFQGGDMLVDDANRRILYAYPALQTDAQRAEYAMYAQRIRAATGYDVLPIERSGYELTNPTPTGPKDLYHLDTFLTQLPNGKLLAFPGGMTAESYQRLQQAYGTGAIIEIPEKYAGNMIPNAAFVGNVMITPDMPDELRERLRQEGVEVLASPKVAIRDSAAHCLTNELPATPTIRGAHAAHANADQRGAKI